MESVTKKKKLGWLNGLFPRISLVFGKQNMVKPTWPEKTVLVCAIQCIISVPSIIIITPDITSNLDS
jgi:hypothetical protein